MPVRVLYATLGVVFAPLVFIFIPFASFAVRLFYSFAPFAPSAVKLYAGRHGFRATLSRATGGFLTK